LEVVATQPSDAERVGVVLDPGLQDPVERHQPHEGERGQQDEAEGVERRTDARGGGDQPEGDQPTAERAEEHGRSTGGLGDRGGAGALEGEVLGGHETDRCWARLGAGLIDLVAWLPVRHGDAAPILPPRFYG
jgi:hypothetical protein